MKTCLWKQTIWVTTKFLNHLQQNRSRIKMILQFLIEVERYIIFRIQSIKRAMKHVEMPLKHFHTTYNTKFKFLHLVNLG